MRITMVAAVLAVLVTTGARADLSDDCIQDDDYTLKMEACQAVIAAGPSGDPAIAWAVNNLGVAYHRQGENERALDYYSQAIGLNDANPLYHSNRGKVRIDLGLYQEAIADFDVAIGLEPEVAEHYIERGDAQYWLGEYAASIKDYSKAIQRDPNDPDTYNDRGYSYYMLGDYERALGDYDQAIALDSSFAFGYWNRGVAYRDMGEYAQAMQDLDRAVELGVDDASLYNSRAWTAYLGGFDLNQALADADRALELSPGDANTIDTRAHVLAALGQIKQALAAFEQAMDAGGADFVSTYEGALSNHGYDPGIADGNYDDTARQALLACLAAGCRLVE